MRQNRVRQRFDRDIETKHEILIGNRGFIFERDRPARTRQVLKTDRVRFRLDLLDRNRRIDLHFDRNIASGSGFSDGRGRRSLFRSGRDRDVSRTDRHRENELVRVVLEGQCLHIADLDHDRLSRKDVCDRLREDVRAGLFEQGGGFAFPFRRVINGAGFFGAHHATADDALADPHRHIVNGAALRKRKTVNCLDRFGKFIPELLADIDPRERARDLGLDRCFLMRAVSQSFTFFADGEKRALRGPRRLA